LAGFFTNGDGSTVHRPRASARGTAARRPMPAPESHRWRRRAFAGGLVVLAGLALAGVAAWRNGAAAPRIPPTLPFPPAEITLECGDPAVQVLLKPRGGSVRVLSQANPVAGELPPGPCQLQLDPEGPAHLRLSRTELTLEPGGRERVHVLGLPLRAAALVSRPASLPGVRTWTITTRAKAAPRPATSGLAWSGDGLMLAISSESGEVTVWSLESDTLRRTLPHPAMVRAMAWSPDGAILATACDGQPLRLWEIDTDKPPRTVGGAQKAGVLAWSPDGRLLASGGDDGTVQLWEAAEGKALPSPKGLTGAVRSLAWTWSSDHKTLASGGAEGEVQLWDVDAKVVRQTLTHPGGVEVLAWSRDDKFLAIGGADGTVWLWDKTIAKPLPPPSPPLGAVRALAWLPDGRALVGQGAEGMVCVWDAEAGQRVRCNRGMDPGVLSPNGRLLVSYRSDYTARFWDSLTGRPYGTIARFPQGALLLTAEGHYRASDALEKDLVYEVEGEAGSKELTPEAFREKYDWSNDAQRIRLTSR
jgi:WD40 repeat protein